MDINICYLLLLIIIIFLILNFNCKETFNVDGQSSRCGYYIVNVNNNCSDVLKDDTFIPQRCCEAITPNEDCQWDHEGNKEDLVKQLRTVLPSRYNICQEQESQQQESQQQES